VALCQTCLEGRSEAHTLTTFSGESLRESPPFVPKLAAVDGLTEVDGGTWVDRADFLFVSRGIGVDGRGLVRPPQHLGVGDCEDPTPRKNRWRKRVTSLIDASEGFVVYYAQLIE